MDQDKKQRNRRRFYLVDRELQVAYMKFAFYTSMVFVLFTAVFFGGIAVLNYNFFQELGMSAQGRDIFLTYVGFNVLILGGLFVTFAVATYVLVMLVSHRLSGPIFHYERQFRKLAEGEFKTEFLSRRQDELRDLEYALNQYRMMAWQKFEDLERRRETYIRRLDQLPDTPQKVRLKHLLRVPPIEQLTRWNRHHTEAA